MQKAKMGISVGLLAAAIYFLGLFSGYLITVLLVAYVLLFEENEWLKKSAVKAVAVMLLFSLISAILNLIPNAIGVISDILSIFGGHLYIAFISNLISAIGSVLNIIEKLLFLGLGIKALTQGTIAIPTIDEFINKHM